MLLEEKIKAKFIEPGVDIAPITNNHPRQYRTVDLVEIIIHTAIDMPSITFIRIYLQMDETLNCETMTLFQG
jgi:hypothetical protein